MHRRQRTPQTEFDCVGHSAQGAHASGCGCSRRSTAQQCAGRQPRREAAWRRCFCSGCGTERTGSDRTVREVPQAMYAHLTRRAALPDSTGGICGFRSWAAQGDWFSLATFMQPSSRRCTVRRLASERAVGTGSHPQIHVPRSCHVSPNRPPLSGSQRQRAMHDSEGARPWGVHVAAH